MNYDELKMIYNTKAKAFDKANSSTGIDIY